MICPVTEKPPRTLADFAAEAGEGITCPKCRGTSLPVVFTRRLPGGETRRVRECRVCKTRIECIERAVREVEKRD